MGTCARCGGDAEVRLDYARLNLCSRCFISFYEEKVRETVGKYGMLKRGEKVAVAVSGGKDSASLLFALHKTFPDLSLTALHLNLGIPEYSEECEEKFWKLVERVGVKGVVYDLREELGITIPDLQEVHGRLCSPCGTIKRYLLNKLAWEGGFNKLATGHHLDDTAEVLFHLYLQGDSQQLVRLKPVSPSTHPKLVTKVKPLWRMTEKENLLYALACDLPFRKKECPFAQGSRSLRRKKLMWKIEGEIRGFRRTLVSSHLKRFLPLLEKVVEPPPLLECSRCGMPASSDPCAFCRKVELARKAGLKGVGK